MESRELAQAICDAAAEHMTLPGGVAMLWEVGEWEEAAAIALATAADAGIELPRHLVDEAAEKWLEQLQAPYVRRFYIT